MTEDLGQIFAVAIVLKKCLRDGNLEMQLVLGHYDARSSDEALGIAIRRAREKNPEHDIFLHLVNCAEELTCEKVE